MASVKTLAPGTPANDIPIPPRTASNNEMPITPRDTARMVAPDSFTNLAPCVELILSASVFVVMTSSGPDENKNPAMITETRNFSVHVPASLAALSKISPSGCNCGRRLVSALRTLVEASVQ